MRILFVSQWFDPEPAPKGLSFVKALVALGHEVEVVTGFPNYPGGEVYPGHRLRPYKHDRVDGIHIHRVFLYPSHDHSGFKRALNYLSFMVSSFLYLALFSRRADAIYCYHPPLTAGLAVCAAGWLRRTPFVYDIQDLWPETLEATGMVRSRRLLDLVGYLCSFVYRRASRITVLSHGFRQRLMGRGVPDRKIKVIHNWCDEVALGSEAGSPPDVMAGRFNVVFAGNMGRAQALGAVVEAARIVAAAQADVQFIFVGGGLCVEELKAQAQSSTNVVFMPRMSMREVNAVLETADALLVHLRDDPLFSVTIPSKTQAYMAVGKPILMGVRGDAARLVQSTGAGLCMEPEDPASIARAVLELAQANADELLAMGRKGREHYFSTMCLGIGAQHFSRTFQEAVTHE